jgi:hypothetical protein
MMPAQRSGVASASPNASGIAYANASGTIAVSA